MFVEKPGTRILSTTRISPDVTEYDTKNGISKVVVDLTVIAL